MNRRKFLQAVGISGLNLKATMAEATDKKPHYFVMYTVTGGLDNHDMFDPKSVTLAKEGFKKHYFEENTDDRFLTEVKTRNSRRQKTFFSPPAASFWRKHYNDLSVVRGVYMALDRVDHPNNSTMLITGEPRKSISFIPDFSKGMPLSFIQSGVLEHYASNMDGGIPLNLNIVTQLVKKFEDQSKKDDFFGDRVLNRIYSAYESKGNKSYNPILTSVGKLATASKSTGDMKRIFSGFNKDKLVPVKGKIFVADAGIALPMEISQLSFLPILSDSFINGLTKVAILNDIDFTGYDIHSTQGSKYFPTKTMPGVLDRVSSVIQYLKSTIHPIYNEPLFNMTTFMFCSEFGRTLRNGIDVSNSGCDHNTRNNFVAIGGKGIKSGVVLGDSDLKSPSEFSSKNKVHQFLDPEWNMACGLPFDFERCQSGLTMPDGEFRKEDFLNYGSILNTILSVFNKRPSIKIEGTGHIAKVLQKIVA